VFPTSSPVHRAEAADQRVRRRGPGASGEARHHGLGAPRVDLDRSLAPSFYACGIGSWRSQRPSLADYVTGTGPTGGASAAGRGLMLATLYARIAAMRAGTLRKVPRRIRLRVMSAKKRSTRVSQYI
jgi:hypothetical protein